MTDAEIVAISGVIASIFGWAAKTYHNKTQKRGTDPEMLVILREIRNDMRDIKDSYTVLRECLIQLPQALIELRSYMTDGRIAMARVSDLSRGMAHGDD